VARRAPLWNPLRRLRANSGDRLGRAAVGACASGPSAKWLATPLAAWRPPAEPGRRFARGTRLGSPAAVFSPRTGSATIWAACLPSAHDSSRPDGQPLPACGSAPGGLLPLPAMLGLLWNQSDVAAAAAGPASGVAAAYAGMTASSGDGPPAAEAAMAGRVVAAACGPNWPVAHPAGRACRSVTLSGSQIIDVMPLVDRACSRTRTPCRSARRPTANSPMCRDTDTSMTGRFSNRQLISDSRASGMPTPLSLTSISTPPVASSQAVTSTRVCLAEKIVAFSMISASRCTMSDTADPVTAIPG
jgi:hypothetical protein